MKEEPRTTQEKIDLLTLEVIRLRNQPVVTENDDGSITYKGKLFWEINPKLATDFGHREGCTPGGSQGAGGN